MQEENDYSCFVTSLPENFATHRRAEPRTRKDSHKKRCLAPPTPSRVPPHQLPPREGDQPLEFCNSSGQGIELQTPRDTEYVPEMDGIIPKVRRRQNLSDVTTTDVSFARQSDRMHQKTDPWVRGARRATDGGITGVPQSTERSANPTVGTTGLQNRLPVGKVTPSVSRWSKFG